MVLVSLRLAISLNEARFREQVQPASRIVQRAVRPDELTICHAQDIESLSSRIELPRVAHDTQVVRLVMDAIPSAMLKSKVVPKFMHEGAGLAERPCNFAPDSKTAQGNHEITATNSV